VFVALGNVRRVADHQLETLPRHGPEPRAQCKLHLQAQPLGIALCHGQGLCAGVHSVNARLWPLVGQGQGNRTTPGAQVQHAVFGFRRQRFQSPSHQRFRVGAGNQHRRVHLQVQAVKFLVAHQIGQRFTLGAALQQGAQRGHGVRGKRVTVVGQQPGARALQHMAQQ